MEHLCVLVVFIICTCVNVRANLLDLISLDNNDVHRYSLKDRLDASGHEPRFLVLASKVVRPGQVYRVSVSVLASPYPLLMRASLHRHGEQVAAAKDRIASGDTGLLLMKVPSNAKPGDYVFRVEGNVNGVPGGTGFKDEQPVKFVPQFLTILIQTNQLVYNFGQTIKTRIVLLTTELKPYTEPADIYIIDSRGLIMKRWVSQYPYLGVISLELELPEDLAVGWWRIRVVVLSQVDEKKILMERWYTDRFDVYVSLPAFVLETDDYLEGDVSANFTTVAPVYGNASIKAYVRPLLQSRDPIKIVEPYLEDYVHRFYGGYQFKFSMKSLRELAEPYPLNKCEIEVHASVGERFIDFVQIGYARAKVINSSISLQILGVKPLIFKPGMLFDVHVLVRYHDMVPLPEERLKNSRMTVTFLAQGSSRAINETVQAPDERGMLSIKVDAPPDSEKILIRATYQDDVDTVRTDAVAVAMYSREKRYLHISTSTSKGQAGEYAVFHVRSNFNMRTFHYLVVSKGSILQTGIKETFGQSYTITTFSVPLSPEMAPAAKVIVYHVPADGELLADSVILPVEGINRGKFTVGLNKKQDRSGNLIELVPAYTVESVVGLYGVDSDLPLQGKNDITLTSVQQALYRMEDYHSSHIRGVWRDRSGGPEEIDFFVTNNYAVDSNKTFQFSGLVVSTNLNVSSVFDNCDPEVGYMRCVSGQCYSNSSHCNGIRDCDDGTDEGNCDHQDQEEDDLFQFHLYRTNRHNNFYDATGGNFAWHDVVTGNLRDSYVACEVPKGPSLFKFTAFGISKEAGFSLEAEPQFLNSARPFFMTYEAPEVAVLGEQIGIRVVLFNYQSFEIQAEVVLEDCDDYMFVQVGSFGRVKSYNPTTTKGEHQHVVYIKPYSHITVHIPVVSVKRGDVEIKITGRTMVATEQVSIPITFLADGVPVKVHTSLLMDLRAQSFNIKFLDLNITEDPIIPFENQYRRYMFDSPQASVSVIGDVVGCPMETVDKSNFGFSAAIQSGDHEMFGFAYNLLTLNYLRLTNQLTHEVTKQFFRELNKMYVSQMAYFKNGAFTMYKKEPSVWLTAYCVRMYKIATFPDWENQLFIDPVLISRSIKFLLKHQDSSGAFFETTWYPLNRRMSSKVVDERHRISYKNVSLTAHVLLTLSQASDLIGQQRLDVTTARRSAILYLERQIPQLTDPYQVALTTYALMEAGSADSEAGFNKLERMKKQSEGMTYWSTHDIPPPVIVYQSQRPFIYPRRPHVDDALAVEATAYGLLIYIKKGGIIQDQIVKWLNRMRYNDFGFVGTQDTVVALEALTEYSFRTYVRGITNMQVVVESSSNPGNRTTVKVDSNELAKRSSVQVEPLVFGHVDVTAQGSGLSVIQVDIQYNVDRDHLLIPPGKEAFDLNMEVRYHGRNRSHVQISSCVRWTLAKEMPTSGASVLEISLPTGYDADKNALDTYVRKGYSPRLRMARVLPKTAVFMFDYVPEEWTCLTFQVHRWYPVANSTRYLKAKIYEYYAPDHYKETIWEDYDLYVLNICEVCGSYQCPYCPYFSAAAMIPPSRIFLVAVLLLWLQRRCT